MFDFFVFNLKLLIQIVVRLFSKYEVIKFPILYSLPSSWLVSVMYLLSMCSYLMKFKKNYFSSQNINGIKALYSWSIFFSHDKTGKVIFRLQKGWNASQIYPTTPKFFKHHHVSLGNHLLNQGIAPSFIGTVPKSWSQRALPIESTKNNSMKNEKGETGTKPFRHRNVSPSF